MGEGPAKFCVLTTGRTGSTALMDALAKFDDIALPGKDVFCPFNELVHPLFFRNLIKEYAVLNNRRITGVAELVECFFDYNAACRFAGFKSMPLRPDEYTGFLDDKDFTFITLIRRDLASTLSSFMFANSKRTWSGSDDSAPTRWTFGSEDREMLLGTVSYVYRSLIRLGGIPGAIRLTYEDLCKDDFQIAGLDSFFGRPIRLEKPTAPNSGRGYVTNWDEFADFAVSAYQILVERHGPPDPAVAVDASGQ